ncbi:MAG: hypothetical protein ACRD8U_23220 [Pyrinomonadaceae bacterium]
MKQPLSKRKQAMPDAGVAIVAADAFREQSQPFLQRVGPDISTAHERAVRDIGGLIASATSLALAVELYLKALRILVGLQVTAHHDLWALFKGLPKEIKDSVEQYYGSLGGPQGSDIHTLTVKVSVGPFTKEQLAESDKEENGSAQDNSLKSVLKRSKDAFLTWRYFHEQGDRAAISVFHYEFHYLGAAAEAVRVHACEALAHVRDREQTSQVV